MKKNVHVVSDDLWCAIGGTFIIFVLPVVIGSLITSGIIAWVLSPNTEKFTVDTVLLFVVGLLLAGTSFSVPLSFIRSYVLRRRAIIVAPEKIVHLVHPQARVEVMRYKIPVVFPGWSAYTCGAGEHFNIKEGKFDEFTEFPHGIDPYPGTPLSIIEKLKMASGYAKGLFSDGVIVGKKATIWDRLFLLGPRHIVMFPSGIIIVTHKDGLRPAT